MEPDDFKNDGEHHHDWMIKKIEDRVRKFMTGDIEPSIPIPPRRALEISHVVSPPERTREILMESDIIANIECWCRKRSESPCEAPLDVCLIIDSELANDAVAEGRGKKVSVPEAMEILDRTTELGLVHMLLHFRDHAYHAICSCCSCCCHDLLALLKYGHEIVEKSEYVARFDIDACTNCELCLSNCNFNAWESSSGNSVHLDEERCYGCGVCVVHCPEGAIKLVKR